MLYQTKNSVGQFYFEHIVYTNFGIRGHMHRYPELVRVREGCLRLSAEGADADIRAGEYAFIPANSIHAYSTADRSRADICIFSENFVPLFAKETRGKKPGRYVFRCREAVDEFALKELFLKSGTPDVYTLKSVLYAVLGEASARLAFERVTARNELLQDKIVRYVAEHYAENITLRSAAEALGYEPHYLSRCFHGVIPIHFSRYVNLYRVDAATELLTQTDLSITEIAGRSGFQSIRTFNRAFRDIAGCGPAVFQTRFREKSSPFVESP